MLNNLLIAIHTFPHGYVVIAFSKWDIALEVWELVY